MKKRILLPTDFSENAWNAIAYALSIFRNETCDFFVMNAYQVGTSGLMTKMGRARGTPLFRLLKEESESKLEKVLKRIKEKDKNPEHTFKTLSIVDTLANAIGKTVYNKDIDFIIMGTKGATGLKEVFLGSNAYTIIKKINFCPIIAVPDDYKSDGTIGTIVLATGYEHLFELYELKPLLQMAKLFGSQIWITHVGGAEGLTPEQEKARKVVEKHLKGVKHDFVEVPKEASINSAIRNLTEENDDIDMVAMINYEHGFFEKLTHEAVIKKVSFNTHVPFLVVHLFE